MRPEALLLLGATGSGKSPLGDLLEAVGLGGRACRHLDFGALLRAAGEGTLRVARAHRRVILDALEQGRLLEDHEWPVAAALLDAARGDHGDARMVLNGLPRHVGQAEALAETLDIRSLVHLDATAEVLLDRIRRNAGGDREGRDDDAPARVRARIERFEARTRPLLQHYRDRDVPIHVLEVLHGTSAAELRARLEDRYDLRTTPEESR